MWTVCPEHERFPVEKTVGPIEMKENSLQAGFTLIEMMVAIIVMSIGLLGVAGLQVISSKYKINTWARSNVSGLVSDIGERIRVNSDVAGTNAMQGGVTRASEYRLDKDSTVHTWADQQAATLVVAKDCVTTACTPSERATYDMLAWRKQVRALLPQGATWLEGDKGAGFDVTLMWFDKEYTDKAGSVDGADSTDVRTLQTSHVCDGTESGFAQQSCCPADAAAPAGVRCARYRFVP